MLAGGNRHRPRPHGLHPRAAEGRHARDRAGSEIQRLGDRGPGVAQQSGDDRLGGAQPGGLNVVLLHARVGHRAAGRLGQQLEVAAIVHDPEPRRGRADDRDLAGYRHGASFQ